MIAIKLKDALIAAFCIITAALLSEIQCSEEILLQGQYLIKSVKHNEFLYVADKDKIDGDRVAQGSDGIFSKSIFKFEKDPVEGYLIKNVKHNEFLYVADKDRIDGDRVVVSDEKKHAKSYFDIISKDGGYVIKSKKHGEYIYLSTVDRIGGDRFVASNGTIMQKSYFNFIAYDRNWFQ